MTTRVEEKCMSVTVEGQGSRQQFLYSVRLTLLTYQREVGYDTSSLVLTTDRPRIRKNFEC